MFILLEKITPYENYFEFECFFNDIEINYSNRLFDIKAYLLVSIHKSFGNRLDVMILPDISNFRNLEFSRKDLIGYIKRDLIMELTEHGICDETDIDIRIIED